MEKCMLLKTDALVVKQPQKHLKYYLKNIIMFLTKK
jgi:hypothetical protein